MKRILGISLFLLALLLACNKQHELVVEQPLPFTFDDNLLLVDSLMQSHADTALRILLSMDKACLVPTGCHDSTSCTGKACLAANANNHYHSLLLSEALYKTYNPQLNRYRNETFRETSLQDAMHYFDSLAAQYPDNDDFIMLSARSHYMNGVGYYENDSVVDACKEYLHALEIMEDHLEERDLVGFKAKFMGLTCTRLGELFYNNDIAEASLVFFKNALKHYSVVNNYNLANPYRSVGSSYYLAHKPDSALFYYRKARLVAKTTNKTFVYSSALSESAPIYYDLGYSDSAFIMIKNALLQPISDDARLAQYHTLGHLYYKEGLYDSAILYLKQSVKSNYYATQTSSSELLMSCYQALGDTAKANYYKSTYENNFTEYRNYSDLKTELNKLYYDYRQQRLDKDNLFKRMRQNQLYFIVFSVVLLLIVSIIVTFKIKVRKTINKSKNDIADRDRVLADMKRKLGANQFINERICNYIWEVVAGNNFKAKIDYKVYKDHALNKNQIMMLRDAVDRHYDNFTQTLVKKYPELTVDDIDYCCLYLLGLKDADVSALMQRAYPTVHQRGNKLKHIFNTKESLQSTISAMASKSCPNT